jgi:uncharacterized protein
MKAMLRIRVSIAVWIAAFVCMAVPPAFSQAVKDLPKPTDYVSDYAHVMSPQAKDQLNHLCGEVDHEAHAQIAVVTIDTLNGEPLDQYAVELEDAWKVGLKGTDRGVIVLLAVKDRRRFIGTGYGLEGILPDGKVGDIGRQMNPMLRNNDFDGALTLAVDEISQIIAQDAGVKLQPLTRWGAQQQPQHATIGQIIGGIVFLILVVIFLIWAGGSSACSSVEAGAGAAVVALAAEVVSAVVAEETVTAGLAASAAAAPAAVEPEVAGNIESDFRGREAR